MKDNRSFIFKILFAAGLSIAVNSEAGMTAAMRFLAVASQQSGPSNTVALYHFDSDLSDSKNGHTGSTNLGGPTINGTSPKFGAGSALFGGTAYMTIPDHSDFDFGSGDFTIEFWMYTYDGSVNYSLIGKRSLSSSFGPFHIFMVGGHPRAYLSSNGTTWDMVNAADCGTTTNFTWHHVALSRVGTSIKCFLDGVSGSTSTSSASLTTNSSAVIVGGDTNANLFDGKIDELRITKGQGRYSGNFTPPASPFSN